MPTGTLTYNLEDSLNAIQTLIDANEVSQFTDFITPCFSVDNTDDCLNLVVVDNTDYTGIDTNNLTYTVTVTQANCNERPIVVVATTSFTSGSTVMYGESDGIAPYNRYLVTLELEYSVGGDTYNDTIEIYKTINCCSDKIHTLAHKIKCKEAQVVCKMKDYLRMGRSVLFLQNTLFKLTLLLNLLENCCYTCEDYEKVLFEFNGIKTLNC